jgi:DNA-nicking Smr family endonuclease
VDRKKSSDEFGDYVKGVERLAPASGRVAPVGVVVPRNRIGSALDRAGSGQVFDVEDDGITLRGSRPGLERTARELARGKVAVFDTIDLHGLRALEAERALVQFCKRTMGSYRRAVLVVHGRGTHSPGGRGVLRDQIASWLVHPPFDHIVLCFATARPEDGGAGATYVLLSARGDDE